VNGDRVYNGALDDAAYVATLIDFADQLHAAGRRFKRSILFCVFTAEERGLLGSQYFVAHPTIPREALVANINLDALRPIFPLRSLTTLGLDRSTLGEVARQIGGSVDIRIKPDDEPDRNLLRRSDQWNFLQVGIPSLAFVFGYERGSSEEAIYRRWYSQRYHSPSDDANQPWNPDAAARFNDFFARLVETVADAPARPSMIEQAATGPGR
jgi:Zn-dependent M28 family amino/carboxypeptidase